MRIDSTNPSRNYAVIDSVEATTEREIIALVDDAKKAQKLWRDSPLGERIAPLEKAYTEFEREKESLAKIIAEEMGMPIRQARDEVGYGLFYFRWYLDNAEKYLSPEVTRETESELHTVFYEPKGVIAAITPWNYPFMLFVWACIQPLLAGNTVIWKISKETILTGKHIEAIMMRSGLPKGVWSEVFGGGDVGDILTDQDIDGIAFTGSTGVGMKLREKAHQKGILALTELGGSAPGIIFADADIDKILDSVYFFRFSNSGQMCDGLKRLIVHESRYDEVVEKLRAKLASQVIGDALDETTDVGPLVSLAQLETLQKQEKAFLESGARIIARTPLDDSPQGAYYPPTLLGNIDTKSAVWREEVFGPLLPIVSFRTVDEAIAIANDTPYGLGAYVFTESRETFTKIASELQTGMVQMNTLNYCTPENPFGGYKSSGFGREHGRWGFHEFCNVKVISIPK